MGEGTKKRSARYDRNVDRSGFLQDRRKCKPMEQETIHGTPAGILSIQRILERNIA